jgi:hypothetical protein
MTSKAILQQGPKEVAVGLSPERLLVRRDALIERYRWSAIDQFSVEPDRFALRLPNGFEIAVPLRAFPDHQSVIDFETTARRFMAAAQDSAA